MGNVIYPAGPSSFIRDAPMTLEELYSSFPPTANNQFMYARVSDLYSEAPAGQQGGVVINETGGHWRPQRADRLATLAGDINRTLTPLRTPPFVVLTGILTATRTLTFDTARAFPGQSYVIRREATGILGIVLAGLGLSLGANGWMELVFDGTSFKQVRSSGLL